MDETRVRFSAGPLLKKKDLLKNKTSIIMQELTDKLKFPLSREDEIRIATAAQEAILREITAHRERDEYLGLNRFGNLFNYIF